MPYFDKLGRRIRICGSCGKKGKTVRHHLYGIICEPCFNRYQKLNRAKKGFHGKVRRKGTLHQDGIKLPNLNLGLDL